MTEEPGNRGGWTPNALRALREGVAERRRGIGAPERRFDLSRLSAFGQPMAEFAKLGLNVLKGAGGKLPEIGAGVVVGQIFRYGIGAGLVAVGLSGWTLTLGVGALGGAAGGVLIGGVREIGRQYTEYTGESAARGLFKRQFRVLADVDSTRVKGAMFKGAIYGAAGGVFGIAALEKFGEWGVLEKIGQTGVAEKLGGLKDTLGGVKDAIGGKLPWSTNVASGGPPPGDSLSPVDARATAEAAVLPPTETQTPTPTETPRPTSTPTPATTPAEAAGASPDATRTPTPTSSPTPSPSPTPSALPDVSGVVAPSVDTSVDIRPSGAATTTATVTPTPTLVEPSVDTVVDVRPSGAPVAPSPTPSVETTVTGTAPDTSLPDTAAVAPLDKGLFIEAGRFNPEIPLPSDAQDWMKGANDINGDYGLAKQALVGEYIYKWNVTNLIAEKAMPPGVTSATFDPNTLDAIRNHLMHVMEVQVNEAFDAHLQEAVQNNLTLEQTIELSRPDFEHAVFPDGSNINPEMLQEAKKVIEVHTIINNFLKDPSVDIQKLPPNVQLDQYMGTLGITPTPERYGQIIAENYDGLVDAWRRIHPGSPFPAYLGEIESLVEKAQNGDRIALDRLKQVFQFNTLGGENFVRSLPSALRDKIMAELAKLR